MINRYEIEKELVDNMIEEGVKDIAKELKEKAKELADDLKPFGKIFLDIKFAYAKAETKEDKERIARSEQYAWAGMEAVKAIYLSDLENKTWEYIETFLNIITKALFYHFVK